MFLQQFGGDVVTAEAGFYWSHRISHKVPVLWKFHELHHSIKQMDCELARLCRQICRNRWLNRVGCCASASGGQRVQSRAWRSATRGLRLHRRDLRCLLGVLHFLRHLRALVSAWLVVQLFVLISPSREPATFVGSLARFATSSELQSISELSSLVAIPVLP